jgi:putative ABC transport system permease protein
MRAILRDEGQFQVSEAKKDTLEGGGIQIGDVFLMISSFAILAGVLLIVNIYAMLAEERKGELGILRAVALKRGALVRTFVYEGYAYSLIASVIGTFVGLGIAYGLVRGINRASGEFADLFSMDLTIPFSARPASLAVALSAGLLVTFLAVLVASARVGNLNVVSAIRDLPEPQPLRPRLLVLVPPALLILSGLALLYAGYAYREDLSTEAGYLLLVGPVVALFGLGLLLSRLKALARTTWTLVGAGMLSYAYLSNEIETVARANEASPAMFFFQGAFMVLGAVLVVSFNLGMLYGVLRGLTRVVPPLAPVLRVAVAHPAARPGRTGFTLAMFALILYVVTVAAIFSATQNANLERNRDEQLSGYDGAVQSGPTAPIKDFEKTVNEDRTLREGISGNTRLVASGVELPDYKASEYTTETGPPIGEAAPNAGISEYVTYVPEGFLRSTTDILESRSPEYASDREAWLALMEDPDLAILTFPYNGKGNGVARPKLGAGDTLTLRDPLSGEEVEKEVIGRIKDPGGFPLQVVNGVIIGEEARDDFENLPTQETFLLRLEEGADEPALARALKQEFAETGAQSFLLDDILGRIQRFQNTFVGIVQAFLAFGLVVGVAGLSVISARAVRERRREIGTLRAVGFKGRTVGWQFVVESSAVAVLGIVLGIAVGTLGGYNLFTYAIDDPDAVFVFPWTTMVSIGFGVWAASLVFTLAPAVQASRVPPVEALRYEG